MTIKDPADAQRSVVVHEDDVGMTHGANIAFAELSASGTCSAGSVMVPCPWFPEAADMAVSDTGLDIGVHLTLTSEKQRYRWRPLTAPPRSAGLTDNLGYFWPDVPSVRQKAAPAAVEAELRAQIDTAIAAGIDITHLDGHMGTVMMPEFVEIYCRLGREYRLPILLVKDLTRFNPMSYAGDVDTSAYHDALTRARAEGQPIFDLILETPWARSADVDAAYGEMFADIPDGLTYLSLHFNAPGDFEVVEPEFAHIRTDEYALFKTARIDDWVREHNLKIIGLRAFRDALRDQHAAVDT